MTSKEVNDMNGLSNTESAGSRVILNSSFRFGGELGCRIIGMFMAVWLARYLGDAVFGRYIFIVTLIGFARIATSFGLDQVLIRAVAKRREETRSYLGAGLIVRLAIFILGIPIIIFFISLVDKTADFKQGMFVGYMAILFMVFNQTFDNVFNGHERFGITSAFHLIAKIVQILFIGAAVYFNLGLVWIIGTFVASEFFRTIALWMISNRELGHPILNREKIIEVTRQSLPFLGITILAIIESRSDVILLGLWHKDEVMGWYGAAINLSFSFLIISASVSDVLFPVFSRLTDPSQRERLNETHKRSLAFLLIVTLPISLSITILSGRIIRILYPETFAPAAIILAISIWLISLKAIGSGLVRIINAFHYEKLMLYVTAMVAFLKIAIGALLISRYGQIGAVLSSVLVSLIMTITCIVIGEVKIGGLKYPFDQILRATPALTCLGIYSWLMRESHLALLVPGGIILYAALILLFRAITVREMQTIGGRIFRKRARF